MGADTGREGGRQVEVCGSSGGGNYLGFAFVYVGDDRCLQVTNERLNEGMAWYLQGSSELMKF